MTSFRFSLGSRSTILGATLLLGAMLPGVSPARADQVADFVAGITQSCADCDLSNRDFSRRDLSKAQLPRANLTNSRFFEPDLRGAVLTGAQLVSADFSRALLTG